jgi:hypothetical protein
MFDYFYKVFAGLIMTLNSFNPLYGVRPIGRWHFYMAGMAYMIYQIKKL